MPNIIEITDLNHPALAPYFRLTEAHFQPFQNVSISVTCVGLHLYCPLEVRLAL